MEPSQPPLPKKPASYFEEGSILGAILKMGIPSMIGFVSTNVYDLADMFWVSRLGADRIAAITLFQTFGWVISSANMIIGTGSVAVISRRYGQRRQARTEASIKETLFLKWIAGIIFGAFGFIVLPKVMYLIGARDEVLGMSIAYGRIIFVGLGLSFATFSLYTALRSIGDPNKAMYLMFIATVSNIILDPFFIFGWGPFPRLGLEGAAVATVLSYVITYGVGMVIFYGGMTNVRLHLRGKEPLRWSSMRQIMSISLPSAISHVSWSLGRLVIMPFIAAFGTGIVAAYGMSGRIVAVGVLLVFGLGLGVASLIGQTLGAKLQDRAKKTAALALRTAVIVNLGYAALVGALATWISGLFLHEPELVRAGAEILRISAISFPFMGAFIMMEEIHSGAGDTLPPMFFNILLDWILMVPLVFIGTRWLGFGPTEVWWTITLAIAVATFAFFAFYRKETWLARKV
jgi:putative MATE family efflux protein